jgi:hemolysin activation/secretion protein
MSRKILLPFALLSLSSGAFAADLPNVGGQMQQIPPPPTLERTAPRLDVKPSAAPATAAADRVKIVVRRLTVTGSQAFSEATLLEVAGFQPGAELSLTDLRGMAAKMADHYHRNGYFVAQAYLPEQDVKDGVVTIAVIDGRYGKVTLNNQTNVSPGLAGGLLDGLNSGDPVLAEPLESRLLLLSDLPGVTVNSTLVPGAAFGTSDLQVDLVPGPSVHGSIDADNAGNPYTGANRIGATVYVNELLGLGDVASLRVLTSGSGMNYARAAYQLQFGKATAGVAYSQLNYKLGKQFAPLQAHGTEKIASVFGSYPLIRSRNTNLYAGLAFDARTFRDQVDSVPSVAEKRADVLMASLYGNHRDTLGGGGSTSYAITWSAGELDLQTPAVRTLDAATARTNGSYGKLGFSLSRLQNLTDSVSLSAAVNGQAASKNLDPSEKMELGGMYAVRAYPEGEAFADEGYVLNIELRYLLPNFAPQMPGRVELIGFVDTGSVTINRNPWNAGPNHRTLSGAGVGFNWFETNNFMLRAYYAFKLGSEAATSAPDKSGRFWIQGVKFF